MEPLLSIILPCYNMESYLDRCFDSILSQNVSYPFEIIAVDDASTDSTKDVLKKYASNLSNLIVIRHIENKKLTGARTSGMQVAKGKYLMHVDPDDYLLPNTLASLFDDNKEDWDILMTNILVEGENKKIPRYNFPKRIYDLSLHEDRKIIFNKIIEGSCFAKIIKREILVDLEYYNHNYNMGEDRAFNVEVFSRAKVVCYDDRFLYFYAFNPKSLVHTCFNVSLLDWDNCWARNIFNISQENKLSAECRKASIREIERNSIGMLLKIRKEQNSQYLFKLWKRFFDAQIPMFGNIKRKWYKTILGISNSKIATFLLLLSPMQIAPLKERIYRVLNIC